MSDNIGYTPGTGAIVAADNIAGVLHQRVKLGVGGDGVATDVSAANPMPVTAPGGIAVTGALTDAELRAAAVPVSGPITDAELRATAVPVSDEDVARLLVRVLNLLGAPVNYDPALNRQRMTAILESGTLTTVTTVGTLTEITNFGTGRTATELQNNQSLAAWAACHASRVF
jgi:hypothetical protein